MNTNLAGGWFSLAESAPVRTRKTGFHGLMRFTIVIDSAQTTMRHTVNIQEFLRESNAIENVHEDDALVDAMDAWEYLQDKEEITHAVVKGAHERLLHDRQPEIAGEYRDVQVRIGGEIPPHPSVVEDLMDELVDRTPTTGVEAINWHVDFEKIHPFQDGNGRVGRLLYLWHCQCHLDIEPVMWRADDVAGYYALFSSSRSPTTET